MENHVVIMAGGIGSRFWPMSTPEYPKQFVDVLGTGKTMMQMTVERFAPLCPIENFWRNHVPVILLLVSLMRAGRSRRSILLRILS